MRAGGAAILLGWMLWFGWDGLGASFAPDDMMNLGQYWHAGMARSLLSNILIGSDAYRPMGAAFYLPIYALFGLDPMPFRVAILILLILNTILTYRLVKQLGGGEVAAGLAALLTSYHAGLADLHYNTAVVYDVLCYLFYCATLTGYVRIRREGRKPRKAEWAWGFVLCLSALNSKEMAATLPVVVLAYEWLFERERTWAPGLAMGALAAVSIAGKLLGGDSLLAQAEYRPVLTVARFFENSVLFANELVYSTDFFSLNRVVILWAAMAAWAWWSRRPELQLAWVLLIVAPLPVVFLSGRIHSCLYLPLLGWAIYAAVCFDCAVRRISQGNGAARALLTGAALLGLAWTTDRQKRKVMPQYEQSNELTARVIRQFRELEPRATPGSSVLLVNDPFPEWDAQFIADLWFQDRSVSVWLQNKAHFRQDEIREKMQLVLRFDGDRLVAMDPAQMR